MPPAHTLMISAEVPAAPPRRYWNLPEGRLSGFSERDGELCVLELLDRSVRQRLVADVPVGGFLSGGVDSSLVMALAARHQADIHTFSIGYEDSNDDELPFARIVAESIHSTHHEMRVGLRHLIETLPALIGRFGQPFGDSSCIPTYWVSRLAREHVKVCLSGDGGDESFGGYRRASVAWLAQRWGRVVPRSAREMLDRFLPSRDAGRGFLPRAMVRGHRVNALSLHGASRPDNTLSW